MSEKKNSDAKIRANNKYSAQNYDRINMALPRGSKKLIAYCAEKNGESINRYVCRVVLEAVRNEIRKTEQKDVEFFEMF